jgi:RNA polymerase sigma factor (sigma-70 family)
MAGDEKAGVALLAAHTRLFYKLARTYKQYLPTDEAWAIAEEAALKALPKFDVARSGNFTNFLAYYCRSALHLAAKQRKKAWGFITFIGEGDLYSSTAAETPVGLRPEQLVAKKELYLLLQQKILELPATHQRILRERWQTPTQATFKQLGDMLNVSGTRIEQRQYEAFTLLRQALREEYHG